MFSHNRQQSYTSPGRQPTGDAAKIMVKSFTQGGHAFIVPTKMSIGDVYSWHVSMAAPFALDTSDCETDASELEAIANYERSMIHGVIDGLKVEVLTIHDDGDTVLFKSVDYDKGDVPVLVWYNQKTGISKFATSETTPFIREAPQVMTQYRDRIVMRSPDKNQFVLGVHTAIENSMDFLMGKLAKTPSNWAVTGLWGNILKDKLSYLGVDVVEDFMRDMSGTLVRIEEEIGIPIQGYVSYDYVSKCLGGHKGTGKKDCPRTIYEVGYAVGLHFAGDDTLTLGKINQRIAEYYSKCK